MYSVCSMLTKKQNGTQITLLADNKEAVKNYEMILNYGYFSEDLFLNLGNAYFQESNFGQARWSYEMGLKLNPMNTDLQNNSNINKLYIEGFIDLPKNNLIDFLHKFSTYDVPQVIYKKYHSEMKYYEWFDGTI